jgi:hypothetical protein
MAALSNFLVLLAIFLLAHSGNVFICMISVPCETQPRVNHLIQLKEAMLKPTNGQNDQTTNDNPAFKQLSVPRPNNVPEK